MSAKPTNVHTGTVLRTEDTSSTSEDQTTQQRHAPIEVKEISLNVGTSRKIFAPTQKPTHAPHISCDSVAGAVLNTAPNPAPNAVTLGRVNMQLLQHAGENKEKGHFSESRRTRNMKANLTTESSTCGSLEELA